MTKQRIIISKTPWGMGPDGLQADLYTLSNEGGMEVRITNLGATVVGIKVPDRRGVCRDVVLGYDRLEDCLADQQYLGVIVGPVANCIEKACFTMDGITYPLEKSDGRNTQHSHTLYGYHKRYWQAELLEDGLRMTLKDPREGTGQETGFPGQKEVEVSYRLDSDNALSIAYRICSDCKTPLNPTSHIYFNLEGHEHGSVLDHRVQIWADRYTPIKEGIIPTGEMMSVAEGPMDFRAGKTIRGNIGDREEQLQLAEGYDHNFVLRDWTGKLRLAARAEAPESGIGMEVYTTLPGLQFYTANGLLHQPGKEGAVYEPQSAFCMETQYFPNSVNIPSFPSCFFEAREEYRSETVYQFKIVRETI